MIKIVIADNQKLFRESLKNILDQDEEFSTVGCAENGMEAAELCNELSPDIVLTEIKLPVCDGLESVKLIKAKHPQIKVIFLTVLEEERYIRRALELRVDGFILKDISPEDLKQALKSTIQGFGIISKKVYDTILSEFNKENNPAPLLANPANFNLKEHELRIIRFVADGKNNKEIASHLNLSEGRIKNVISELLLKLNLRDRYQLLSFAYKNNLVK